MISIAQARNQFTTIIHHIEGGQPITISRRGKPVAVMLSMGDYERLLNAQSPGLKPMHGQIGAMKRSASGAISRRVVRFLSYDLPPGYQYPFGTGSP